MSDLKIAFDVSQTGRHKAGCRYYAASLIEGLLASEVSNDFTLLTSFGDFFHDPSQALAIPNLGHGVHRGGMFGCLRGGSSPMQVFKSNRKVSEEKACAVNAPQATSQHRTITV